MEIRDKLDQLIKSLAMENKEGEKAKEEPGKKMHRLTPAELGKKDIWIYIVTRALT